MKRIAIVICIILCLICLPAAPTTFAKDYSKSRYDDNRWETIKVDYLDTETDRLIFVKYKGGSSATVEMWKKLEVGDEPQNTEMLTDSSADTPEEETVHNYTWEKVLSTRAYVGKNGLNKVKQGDMKTPAGIYNITMAFGRKKSPGTAGISYTKLTKYHYWSDEKDTYNQFVDVRKLNRTWMSGEHMIDYDPWYDYGVAMDYNKKCKYLKGAAIFLHCEGKGRKYTHGCIAVPKTKMKKIVKNTTNNTKICIYKK